LPFSPEAASLRTASSRGLTLALPATLAPQLGGRRHLGANGLEKVPKRQLREPQPAAHQDAQALAPGQLLARDDGYAGRGETGAVRGQRAVRRLVLRERDVDLGKLGGLHGASSKVGGTLPRHR